MTVQKNHGLYQRPFPRKRKSLLILMDRQTIFGVGLCLVVLTTAVLATIIDYWASFEYVLEPTLQVNSTLNVTMETNVTMGNKTVTRHEGIWRTCVKSDSGTACDDVTSLEDYHWIHACQTLMILGSIALSVATIVPCVPIVSAKFAAISALAGGVCFSAAAILFGVKYSSLHAAFGLAVMAGQLATVAGWVLWTSWGAKGYREI